MAISFQREGGAEDELASAINTTPLVDVMLVLLIIFLITVPVVTHSVPVALPNEYDQPTKVKPNNVVIAVDSSGNLYWNDGKLPTPDALLQKLEQASGLSPQPEVQIRADKDALYAFVGDVMLACQRAGIAKVSFITQPEHGAAVGG